MLPENRAEHCCAVCGRAFVDALINRVAADDAYDRAFLDPKGLIDTNSRGDLLVCKTCLSALEREQQPIDSIANYQYYAHELLPSDVRHAFESATMADQISFMYTSAKGGIPGAPQRYMQGNVAIIPQDVGSLQRLLPPCPDDTDLAMCVLFNIDKLVRLMLQFLTEHNPFYREQGIQFSESNLTALTCDFEGDRVQHLPFEDSAAQSVVSGYAERVVHPSNESDSEPFLEARALQWCKDHKPFVRVSSGSQLFPDRDPRMLTFAFPHLDPWGIGGFYHPLRDPRRQMSFERQLKNLLSCVTGPFRNDPNLAYIGWNCTRFQLDELGDTIRDMSDRWEEDIHSKPQSADEKRALQLLNKLKVLAQNLRGSNGHKIKLRNQIRALLKQFGCPSLFITRLLHTLAGGDPARAKNAAKHPDAAAKFFDVVIQAFMDIIVRYGRDEPGLFGHCVAYFGTVEAQGRGTLHSLNPQALRKKMMDDDLYKNKLFSWIEIVLQHSRTHPVSKPRRGSAHDTHLEDGPFIPDPKSMSDDERDRFEQAFCDTVTELAEMYNWHEHHETCWKHLAPGEPRDDDHCRMCMDGKTKAVTDLDPETQSVRLRRLHPWINNFNDVVMFLLKCNMDIKFIGSGEAAKALIFYITDYITKSSLPTHVGLRALTSAIKSNGLKFAQSDADHETVGRSLLTKVVNSMMARQELSHQQVMSYLVGGGDHYTSHMFQPLHWGSLDAFFRAELGEQDSQYVVRGDVDGDVDDEDNPAECITDFTSLEDEQPGGGPNITITVNADGVTGSSLLLDYRMRGVHPDFEKLSVWEHVAYVQRLTKKTRTRTAADRTHVSRLRTRPFVPVILGPTIGRTDREFEERSLFCRAMLILFKPWRRPSDLKMPGQTWKCWSLHFYATRSSPSSMYPVTTMTPTTLMKEVGQQAVAKQLLSFVFDKH
ncbi:hypothetical protein DENSPDRAFT_861822 [Dentipellis sp. KUC8613]|nr:hypothetical protein DENSPDRAFT_861822 [Dentipellis sp. KUC8613]